MRPIIYLAIVWSVIIVGVGISGCNKAKSIYPEGWDQGSVVRACTSDWLVVRTPDNKRWLYRETVTGTYIQPVSELTPTDQLC